MQYIIIGTAAGVYAGMEYGVERIRGKRDWVISDSSMLGCIITSVELFYLFSSSFQMFSFSHLVFIFKGYMNE